MTSPDPGKPGGGGSREAAVYPVVPPIPDRDGADPEVAVDVGWGRLIFGQTFPSVDRLVEVLRQEAADERDIAIYVDDPHVALTYGPQDIFIDPSHTYRLDLSRIPEVSAPPPGVRIRRFSKRHDAIEMNRIYASHGMVQIPVDFLLRHVESLRLTWLVAVDEVHDRLIGVVMGVDHAQAFNDPQRGSSLWGLAVDTQAPFPAIGETLVRALARFFAERGRAFMDLSVLHDNEPAIALYERLGFSRIQTFTLKCKNPVNEPLYVGQRPAARLNPYSQVIINEAFRRGIAVEIEDEEANLFKLIHGGRRVACRESLSELTSSVAVQRCDDKALTRRLLVTGGLSVPRQQEAGDSVKDLEFLQAVGRIVVKPARGEQGAGITVDVAGPDDMDAAVNRARQICDKVLLEEFCAGLDLRVIVIGRRVVAAAVRKPAGVIGDGHRTIRELIERQSRRRKAVTGGESHIPLDGETERCVRQAGFVLDDIPADGQEISVRKTANLHTGGTIHDVTGALHADLSAAAERAAQILDIPVVGLDFLVPSPERSDYVIIEANERPGLANHEPQPTAERFIDLLFPQTALHGDGRPPRQD